MKNTASRCRGYFYPRSPCGERRLSYFYIIKITQFLSTLSLRRATIPDREPAAGYLISIHALLAESDPTRWAPTCRISNFYPRSPCGERLVALLATGRAGYFYPRSPCGERPNHFLTVRNVLTISIHALLAESDISALWMVVNLPLFLSTLSLRRATPVRDIIQWEGIFLSTLSLRRATAPRVATLLRRYHFYPRSPCGERPSFIVYSITGKYISIHALLAESDRDCDGYSQGAIYFYPRSPCGERPGHLSLRCTHRPISIHALLAESDPRNCPVWSPRRYFYPRSPCGERLVPHQQKCRDRNFYPRSPCGERPAFQKLMAALLQFLSTLSLRRATFQGPGFIGHRVHFYPRSPCGERQ